MTITLRNIDYDKYHDIIDSMQMVCLESDDPREFKPADYWIVGFDGKDPACFSVVSRVSNDTYYLSRAGVLPEYRGMGLQLKMIKARVKKVLAENNSAHIVTDTVCWNTASSNNLIRGGFLTYWPETPWALDDSVYWQYCGKR